LGVEAVVATHFTDGGQGAEDLARAVLRCVERNRTRKLRFAYPLDMPLADKILQVARNIYGAKDVEFERRAKGDLKLLEQTGYGQLPICIAKTPKSLSDQARLRGRPRDFTITVTELRISAGAGFVVVICGDIVTMPGLPKVPAAARIKVGPDGIATGLS
jgi:formate--tetrahydrofolate ligase